MTNDFFRVIVVDGLKKGPRVRKGKAMLLIHTYNFRDSYRLSDLQGTIMPAAKKAEWLPSTCLIMTGSGGYLEPGAFLRTGKIR